MIGAMSGEFLLVHGMSHGGWAGDRRWGRAVSGGRPWAERVDMRAFLDPSQARLAFGCGSHDHRPAT